MVCGDDIDSDKIDSQHCAVHGFAWVATYVEALRQSLGWAERLQESGQFGGLEQLFLQLGFGGYLAELANGIAMSQIEIVRPTDLGLAEEDIVAFRTEAVRWLIQNGNNQQERDRLSGMLVNAVGALEFGELGLDETNAMVRQQFRRFTDDHVSEAAHGWHLRDELIPMEVVDAMRKMGVFGLTIPEKYGGGGMGTFEEALIFEEFAWGDPGFATAAGSTLLAS